MTRTKQEIKAAMSRGAMQYPKTQRPWKNELFDEYFELSEIGVGKELTLDHRGALRIVSMDSVY